MGLIKEESIKDQKINKEKKNKHFFNRKNKLCHIKRANDANRKSI
jgi:hypothetical protein